MNGNENRYLGEEPVENLMQKYAIPPTRERRAEKQRPYQQ